jgi:exodeoxyribonuclease V alpha subunit
VQELAALAGDGYEAWVAGLNPGTGEPRGRLRGDGRAVRFVEMVVNGPKSWSLAAALHHMATPPTPLENYCSSPD